MKDLNLYAVARDRASKVFIGSADVEIVVKKTYGLDRTSIKLSSNDQVFSLIEKSSNESYNYIKPSNLKLDPINDFAKENFSTGTIHNSGTHPMDAAYDLLIAANESVTKSERRNTTQAHNRDEINSLCDKMVTTKDSKHSRGDVIALIRNIYGLNLPQEKTSCFTDPVNDIVKSYQVRFSSAPLHTLAEWTNLINNSLDPDPDHVSSSIDPVNDFAADQFGHERPTSKALSQIETRLMDATYQLNYKLTSGSNAYKKKSEEIKALKAERETLQNY